MSASAPLRRPQAPLLRRQLHQVRCRPKNVGQTARCAAAWTPLTVGGWQLNGISSVRTDGPRYISRHDKPHGWAPDMGPLGGNLPPPSRFGSVLTCMTTNKADLPVPFVKGNRPRTVHLPSKPWRPLTCCQLLTRQVSSPLDHLLEGATLTGRHPFHLLGYDWAPWNCPGPLSS